MQAFGVPRLDPGYEGIHLVWSWPDVLPLSEHGYDIQRLDLSEERIPERCETIDTPVIAALRKFSEYPALLGPLRLRTGAKLVPINDPKLVAGGSDPGDHPPGFGPPSAGAIKAAVAGVLAAAPAVLTTITAASTAPAPLEEYIQELDTVAERVVVTASARVALAIALYRGKVVAVAPAAGSPLTMQLAGSAIDSVVVYVSGLERMTICAFERPQTKPDGQDAWTAAPYVVKGLTLPVREADASLATPALEYAKAKSRLLGGETLALADFQRLAATLRAPAGATYGRSGERALLVRSAADQSFEEMPFEAQLSALAVHPKTRRILGFGYADGKGLTPGHTYLYRVTGRFRAEDLGDRIYDVHLVPASTALPASFTIRDLSLRFQAPVKVVLDPPPPNGALQAVSRRGIRIDVTGHDGSWLLPSLDAWSAVIDFPAPVTKVVLEVAPGHAFTYAGGMPWLFSDPPKPLPPGPRAELAFATPVTQVRLAGTGTLFAIRIPSGPPGSIVEVHAYAPPVTYAAQPLPAPPTVLTAYNLQQPPATLSGTIDESTPVQPRPPLGFKLNWLPAVSGGLGAWPDDLDAGPPLDALAYAIEHRLVTPPASFGPWEPVQSGDNLTLGSRDTSPTSARLVYGCDLDALFPRIRPRGAGAGFALHLSDVFGEKDPTTGAVRPAQPLGSYHQYQIRSVDAVGRAGGTTTLSNVARLEKHVPPPVPVAPQPSHGADPPPPPVDVNGMLTTVPGPRARVIVKGAKGLTPSDVTTLGAHQNAIVLEWGWRQQERDLDPTAAEFRVYVTAPPDAVRANVTAVGSLGANWNLALTITSAYPLVANELAGLWIESGGYPFRVVSNEAGMTPHVQVEHAQIGTAQPVAGTVVFGRNLQPEHQRPALWRDRVAVYPITASENYRHVFYDVLTLDAAHPRDTVWAGVSAADAQAYVADERSAGANANRPGNESSIAACTASARYVGQPVFSVPPPLGDVPELVTSEPAGRQILVSLDLVALLGGALPAGSPVSLERCSSDEVISRVALSGNDVVLTNVDGTTQIVAFPNPGDHAAVIAALGSSDPQRLANKYLLHLVVASNDPAAFFTAVSGTTQSVGVVEDRLAPKPGRFLYFARAADALGHRSQGGAILPAVVRVPATSAAPTPRRRALATTNTTVALTVAIPPDPNTAHALLFVRADAPGTAPSNQAGAEILRTPNRRDLYPHDGLRMRLSDGTLLAPAVVKDLADLDVTTEADGTRVATLTANAAHGAWATTWCYALTRDGFPSYVCGPFGTGVGS